MNIYREATRPMDREHEEEAAGVIGRQFEASMAALSGDQLTIMSGRQWGRLYIRALAAAGFRLRR